MNDSPVNQNHMIDITDCLEAVSVFRGWKNLFFVVILVCLLLSQAAFWMINLGIVEPPTSNAIEAGTITQIASQAVTDPNATGDGSGGSFLSAIQYEHVARTIELASGILLVTTVLYVLATFFSLMVSLIGRLGGINHISRAFILSLIMLVLIIPWQNIVGLNVPGLIYTPSELLTWMATKSEAMLSTVFYYLRFSGYFVVVFLLLIMSQIRSSRWAKAILKRLEII